MRTAIVILMQVAWLVLFLGSAAMTALMLAFADSPNLARAAERAFLTTVIAAGVVLCVGGWLVWRHRNWWQVAIAFALIGVPPAILMSVYSHP